MNDKQADGKLITFDGIDGVGKSTQIEKLKRFLEAAGHDVLLVRDPGSTEVGARLRSILLESDLTLHRRTEAMLFMASRCEMIETTVRPALQRGIVVVSDRFLLANVVYQSVGGPEAAAVSADQLWQMGRWANAGLEPDLTILLDMPAAAAMKRIDREADRMESRGIDYMESVRQAFLRQVASAGGVHAVVDADRAPETIFSEICRVVTPVIGKKKPFFGDGASE